MGQKWKSGIGEHGRTQVYKLEDGTELLEDAGKSDPSNCMVPEQEKFDEMKKKVQPRILNYIETQIDFIRCERRSGEGICGVSKKRRGGSV